MRAAARPWAPRGAAARLALLFAAAWTCGGPRMVEANSMPWTFAPLLPDWQPPNWHDLDEHGFVLIRQFVRGDVAAWREAVVENWKKRVVNTPGPGNRAIDSAAMIPLRHAVRVMIEQIRESNATRLEPDTIYDPVKCPSTGAVASYYFVSGKPPDAKVAAKLDGVSLGNAGAFRAGLDWHTDLSLAWHPEDQRADAFLNFYIPVVKPYADDANLGVIPFSAFAPDTRRQLESSSSKVYRRRKLKQDSPAPADVPQTPNTTAWVQEKDVSGCSNRRSFPQNLFDAGFEPNTNEGDLLLKRGDVVHRSGPNLKTPFRLAVSVRALKWPSTPGRAECMVRKGLGFMTRQIQQQYTKRLCSVAGM